ncbi:MAG: rhomboid family intramembrane serine protease [Candidatus Methanomethyliaceae archaeon]|nr:rhomboid family intramembrane serine protease [Candidatus Methanomethyliaceae archaeon]
MNFRVIGFPIPETRTYRPSRPKVTLALIISNIIVYIISSIENGFLSIGDYWVSIGAFVPSSILLPEQWYRIFSSMFLHGDLFHIFFNMYFLYIFGRAVEEALGGKRFLIMYILSGIAASIFHAAFSFLEGPMAYAIPAIGASGAISGVMGAYLIFYPGTSLLMIIPIFFFPWFFWIKAAYYILFWFAVQIIYGFLHAAGGVAVFAHAGGFVMGIAVLSFLRNEERIVQLRLLRSIFSYIRYYSVGTRGLGRTVKIVLSLLIMILLAISLYISAFPIDQGQMKTITVSYRCGSTICNDYVGFQPNKIEEQISNIRYTTTRILFNRLYYGGLLYGAGSIEIRNSSSELPIKISVDQYSTIIKVNTTIDYFKATYGKDGFISYGEGKISTYSIKIFVYQGVYQLSLGETMDYEFSLSTQESDLAMIIRYTGTLSLLFTSLSLIVINLMDRRLAIIGE